MTIACPQCASLISPWKVKREFVCQQCAAPLNANLGGITLIAVVIWSLVEIGIKSVVFSWLGGGVGELAISTLFSGAFGFSLYYVLVGNFCSVQVSPYGPAQP